MAPFQSVPPISTSPDVSSWLRSVYAHLVGTTKHVSWVLIYRAHPRMQDPVQKISFSDTGVYCLLLATAGTDGWASALICFIR